MAIIVFVGSSVFNTCKSGEDELAPRWGWHCQRQGHALCIQVMCVPDCMEQTIVVWHLLSSYYNDATISVIASQITGNPTEFHRFFSGWYQMKHHSSSYWPFVEGNHRWAVHSPYKGAINAENFHGMILRCLNNHLHIPNTEKRELS